MTMTHSDSVVLEKFLDQCVCASREDENRGRCAQVDPVVKNCGTFREYDREGRYAQEGHRHSKVLCV